MDADVDGVFADAVDDTSILVNELRLTSDEFVNSRHDVGCECGLWEIKGGRLIVAEVGAGEDEGVNTGAVIGDVFVVGFVCIV